MAAPHEENCEAGDDDAEAHAQDRKALPFARSSQMQQKWDLHRSRAGNREADEAPDQASSKRRRRSR